MYLNCTILVSKFQLHDFGLVGIVIMQFWSLGIPIVTIRSFCHCIVFNTKNLRGTCEVDLILIRVTYEPHRFLVSKMTQWHRDLVATIGIHMWSKSHNHDTWGTKIAQLKLEGPKSHSRDTCGIKNAKKSIVLGPWVSSFNCGLREADVDHEIELVYHHGSAQLDL